MSEIKIYHNPRCSKSREALALLQEQGINPEITEYLQDAPDANEIRHILDLLGVPVREIMRTGEPIYKELNLGSGALSEDDLINAMVEHPILMERPIVIYGNQARVGRPPKLVLEIL
ncbi:MAG: arsenate reductase (glutaredoxin) [Venatoribacter sp.]